MHEHPPKTTARLIHVPPIGHPWPSLPHAGHRAARRAYRLRSPPIIAPLLRVVASQWPTLSIALLQLDPEPPHRREGPLSVVVLIPVRETVVGAPMHALRLERELVAPPCRLTSRPFVGARVGWRDITPPNPKPKRTALLGRCSRSLSAWIQRRTPLQVEALDR